MHTLLLYYTKTGHTLEAATAVAGGLRTSAVTVDIVPVSTFTPEILDSADALITGSPCWLGNGPWQPAGIAVPLLKTLQGLESNRVAGKLCGGFAVHGGGGGDKTVAGLGEILANHGCREYIPGPVCRAGAPLSLWTGPAVSDGDRARLCAWGEDFALRLQTP